MVNLIGDFDIELKSSGEIKMEKPFYADKDGKAIFFFSLRKKERKLGYL